MEINLDEGKIKVEDKWLSANELKQMIQAKMETGDMKFSDLAASLETLKKAMENSQTLNVNIVISKSQYKKLKSLGKGNDRDCIRKAIMTFINDETGGPGKRSLTIKCANCSAPIKVDIDSASGEIECSKCGARGLLKHRQP